MPTLEVKNRVKLACEANPRSRPIEVMGSDDLVSLSIEVSMRSVLR
jgi:hypothetical protein